MVIGFTVSGVSGPGAPVSDGTAAATATGNIDNYFPKQLPRGQSAVINVAVPGRAMPESAEFSPAAGITVAGIKAAGGGQGAVGWWEITVNVANDAAPGPRTLTLVLPMGRRTNPFRFTVANHGVMISALSVAAAQANRPTVDLQFTAADTANDLGESPYVWFMLRCGPGEPETGVVRGKAAGGAVRASIPNPRTHKDWSYGCRQQVRSADARDRLERDRKQHAEHGRRVQELNAGHTAGELNHATDAAHFGNVAVGHVRVRIRPGGLTEFVSREERFTITFPGKPVISETTWFSEYGAVLPARVYTVSNISGKHTLTVVDYRPIERILLEKAKTCPPGRRPARGWLTPVSDTGNDDPGRRHLCDRQDLDGTETSR